MIASRYEVTDMNRRQRLYLNELGFTVRMMDEETTLITCDADQEDDLLEYLESEGLSHEEQ